MKGKFRKKIISCCMFVICLTVVLLINGVLSEASDTTTEGIQLVTIENYDSAALEKEISEQRVNNYIYAGLYKKGTTAESLKASNVVVKDKVTNGSTYVAKFVPEGVMGIRAQVSDTLLSNPASENSSVRFVTAIDSVLYKEVGFSITRENDTAGGEPVQLVQAGTISKYVYEKLYGIDVTSDNPGEPLEYTPKDIHALAQYFKTYTITGVPEKAYNKELTVTPYWITHDGVEVKGAIAIKTVNLGRSWVYVNATTHNDGNEYGTYDHPFTEAKFATALDNITLDKTGTILLQSNYTIPKGFDWKSHGKDIIVTSADESKTLGFGDTSESIRDGVTFKKIVLQLPTGSVYACGNNFTIESDVTSENPNTVIYGGAYNAEAESTNVTIKSGTYRAIYGGGALVGGIVKKNTNVTLEHCNVYNTSKSHDSRVHGGGNKATVKGNTNVTIGDGFNAGLGNSYADSDMHSTVYGGGYGESGNLATVEGNTKVIIKNGARANYVFGAGGPQSAVEGTSKVLFEGGYAMGLYGGANGSGTNSHTLVKMTGGQVEQIFGGNQSTIENSMVGSSGEKLYADVQVLGGTVTRRIYGGCYNEYEWSWKTTNSVEGYTSVTIASEATVPSGNVCANSRLGTKSENEIGVLVLNQGIDSGCIGRDFGSSLCTNFLVEVPEGGTVTSENGSLNIATDTGNGYNYATVTYAGETLYVVKGNGKCPLPTLNNTTSVQNIEVTFSTESPTIDGFETKNVTGTDVVYYPTFEEAMNMAEEGTNVVVLQNINVDKAYTIEKDLTISTESPIIITKAAELADNMFTVTAGTFRIKGAVDATITLEGNKDADGAVGARAIRVEDGATCETNYVTIQNFSIAASAGAISCSGTLESIDCSIINNTASAGTGGAIYASDSSDITLTRCNVSSNTASNGGGAIHIIAGGEVTSNNSAFVENKTTVSSNGNGGAIYCQGTYNDTNSSYLNNTSARHGGAIIVQNGASATLIGTDANANFSNNTANQSANGNALYVNSGATVRISDYTFIEATQKVQVSGNLTVSNITGTTLVKAASGVINVAGYSADKKLTVTPNKYEADYVVLSKAENVEETVFKAACAGITVTRDSKGQAWYIDEAGKLQLLFEAYIGDTIYEKFTDAIAAANGVESTEDVVVYVHKDVEISSQVTISHNMQIVNEPGKNITITRSTSMTSGRMFYLGESAAARLTFGTNDASEQGTLVVQDNGEYKSATNTRIVDNRANGTFILGKNATLQNANSNQRGSALVNRGTAELYGSVKNNICTGDGGAILQVSGTLTIYDGIYKGNEATKATSNNTAGGLGSVVTAIGGTVDIQGGTFTGNTTASRGSVLHAIEGTTVKISGGNFGGNTAAEGGVIYCYGTLQITGSITEANKLTVTSSEYTEGKEILTKAENITDDVFKAACVGILVTPDANGTTWSIDENGKLKIYVARIGFEYYDTWNKAITAANGYTGADEVVLYVRNDVKLSSGVTISKNIRIQNEPGIDVTFRRSSNIVMFTVSSGAKLTLGTNDETEGKLIVDGATTTTVSSRMVQNPAGATFILGRNATLQNANVNNWGTALNNAGTADLYGSVINNTSIAAGGAILQSNANAKLTIHEGTYTGNMATRTTTVSQGSAIIANGGTVTIKSGTFSNNSTTGAGGAIYVYTKTTVSISGGTFTGNIAGTDGNAIYIASGGTVNVTGGTFATENPAQEIYVAGTLNYSNLPEVLITGTGTKNKTDIVE